MKILKFLPMLLLLLSFMACKKDSAITPEPIKEPFDIRQYVLVLKTTESNGWASDITLITFEAQSKSILYTPLGPIPDNGFNYSYANGTLKVLYYTSVNYEFKVENEVIIPIKPLAVGRSVKLIKIPADNALNGNTYNGAWQSDGSLLFSVAGLKFSDTQYSEASINLPVPNKTYTLVKNVAAYSTSVDNKTKTIWVLIDGKLEGYRRIYNSNSLSKGYGTFIKQ